MPYLTYLGQQLAVGRTAGGVPSAGLAASAVRLRLYSGASRVDRSGLQFVDIAAGNGYSFWTLTTVDWILELVNDKYRIRLADRTLTATGVIANIAGAYVANSVGQVIAWWDRPVLTLQAGSTLVLDDLAISG